MKMKSKSNRLNLDNENLADEFKIVLTNLKQIKQNSLSSDKELGLSRNFKNKCDLYLLGEPVQTQRKSNVLNGLQNYAPAQRLQQTVVF